MIYLAVVLAVVGVVALVIGLMMAPLLFENGVLTGMDLPVGLFLGAGLVAIAFSVAIFRDISKGKR